MDPKLLQAHLPEVKALGLEVSPSSGLPLKASEEAGAELDWDPGPNSLPAHSYHWDSEA